MPQTTQERAARWPGGDSEAIAHLRQRGWVRYPDWCWYHPDDREPQEKDLDAMAYLIQEWDYDPRGYDTWTVRPRRNPETGEFERPKERLLLREVWTWIRNLGRR